LISHDSAKSRTISVFLFCSIVIGLSETWLRFNVEKSQLNLAFKKMKYSIYVVLCVIVYSRFLGWQYHNQYKIVLLNEMTLIILASLLVSINTNRKDFFWGALVCLASSLSTIFYPDQIVLLYPISLFNLWFTAGFFWYKDQKKI
jgi:hypothetical protein